MQLVLGFAGPFSWNGQIIFDIIRALLQNLIAWVKDVFEKSKFLLNESFKSLIFFR